MRNLLAFFKSRKAGERGHWGCLDESQIAAYADRQLSDSARERVEAHLADCDACLEQVVFLTRTQAAGTPETVPDWLLLRAKNLTQKEAKAQRSALWHWGKFAAAVACLALVAAVTLRHPATPPAFKTEPYRVPFPPPAAGQTSSSTPPAEIPHAPKVRGGQKIPLALTVVTPSTASENEIEFHWVPVRGALDYEVQVMTAEGDLLWKQRTNQSLLRLPGEMRLEAGHKYFALVRVYLAEGKSMESRPVAFTATIRR